MDLAGDFVVTWLSAEGGSQEGVDAQRFNAAGVAQGSAFLVNTYTTGGQEQNAVAMDAAGDFVVTWLSPQNGDGYFIYGQRYNASGVAEGSEFQANTDTTGNEENPAVAMDATGDFVVAWDSPSSLVGVYTRRYDNMPSEASAAALGSEFRVNTYTTNPQSLGRIAADAAGDYVVVWGSYEDGDSSGVYGQRYSAAGVPQGSEFRINTYTTGNQYAAVVAMDSAGDFVVAWNSPQDGSDYGVYAQRYNPLGVPQGSEFRVNTYTSGNQAFPSIAMDSAGDFVVSWNSYGEDGSNDGVYAQRYNSGGVPQGSEFQVNTYTAGSQAASAVAMDAAGDFVIVFQSGSNQDGSGTGIYARGYNPDGTPMESSPFLVNTYTTGNQLDPEVAMDSAGDFVVTWISTDEDGSGLGIYAQRYNAIDAAQGSEFHVNTFTFTAGTQGTTSINRTSVAMDANGDFVIAWMSYGEDGSSYGIYGAALQFVGCGASERVPRQYLHHGQPTAAGRGHGFPGRFRNCLGKLWRGWQQVWHVCPTIRLQYDAGDHGQFQPARLYSQQRRPGDQPRSRCSPTAKTPTWWEQPSPFRRALWLVKTCWGSPIKTESAAASTPRRARSFFPARPRWPTTKPPWSRSPIPTRRVTLRLPTARSRTSRTTGSLPVLPPRRPSALRRT